MDTLNMHRVTDVLGEITTKQPPETSPEHYRYNKYIDKLFFIIVLSGVRLSLLVLRQLLAYFTSPR
jgi:hypothetical protein